jgi:ribosomal protein L2
MKSVTKNGWEVSRELVAIQYDPNASASRARRHYQKGKSTILAL